MDVIGPRRGVAFRHVLEQGQGLVELAAGVFAGKRPGDCLGENHPDQVGIGLHLGPLLRGQRFGTRFPLKTQAGRLRGEDAQRGSGRLASPDQRRSTDSGAGTGDLGIQDQCLVAQPAECGEPLVGVFNSLPLLAETVEIWSSL